jgi:hypothetical protein
MVAYLAGQPQNMVDRFLREIKCQVSGRTLQSQSIFEFAIEVKFDYEFKKWPGFI